MLLCTVDIEHPPTWVASSSSSSRVGKERRAIKNYWGHRCTAGQVQHTSTWLRKASIATSGHKMIQAAHIYNKKKE